MPEADEWSSISMLLDTPGKVAAFKQRVKGHEWRIELREHILPEVKRSQGAPSIVVVIRIDGELLATVYPVQLGGIGVQIASTKLDFADAFSIEPEGTASEIAPAVIFLRKDHQGQGGDNGNGR